MSWNYYHQMDPFLIQITENFGLRWYSMAYLLGAFVAYLFAVSFVKQGRLNLSKDRVLDLITYGALGVIIGGRFGYCLFYNPHLFLEFDFSFPFWSVLKIHEGGMASHGGILGLFISLWFFARTYKVSLFCLADLAVLGGAVGIFLGRIANFINGELYGRVIQGKAFFAVKFPSELFLWLSDVSEYRVQLLSLEKVLPSLDILKNLNGNLIPSAAVWKEWVYRAVEDPLYKNKIYYLSSLIVKNSWYPQVKEALEPLLFFRHPSQLYQSFLGGLIPFLIILFVWFKTKKYGVISSVWIFSYVFARLITEFFRMPDSHLGYQWLHLTRGQWLSFGLLLIAFGYSFFVFKKNRQNSLYL